jgi:hypothetical protein
VIGVLLKVVLGVLVIGAGVAVVATIVPTPTACTPDVTASSASDAVERWDAWASGPAPASVTFTEADATAVLREHIAGTDVPLVDPVVHFCSDGSVEVSFAASVGPVSAHGLATGTIAAASPLSIDVTSIQVGALPDALGQLVVGAIGDIAADASSLGLVGPVGAVEVTEGQVTVSQ